MDENEILAGGALLERHKRQIRNEIGVNLNRDRNGDLTSYNNLGFSGMGETDVALRPNGKKKK